MGEKKCVVCEAVKQLTRVDLRAIAVAGYLCGYADGLTGEKYRHLCRSCTALAGAADALVEKV